MSNERGQWMKERYEMAKKRESDKKRYSTSDIKRLVEMLIEDRNQMAKERNQIAQIA